MCGRFALGTPIDEIAASIQSEPLSPLTPFTPSWNVAPTQWVPVITENGLQQRSKAPRHMRLMRWGLRPNWSKPSTHEPNNARAETVDQKPMFRHAWAHRRCIVPADGWYEWMTTVQGKVPWYHHRINGGPCWLGGIWESWSSPAGDHVESFALLTVEANEDTREVHHRMPLLLEEHQVASYLAGDDIRAQPQNLLLDRHVVGRTVNSSSEDGAHLIEAVPTLW
ncbi:MAG: SOS response-associated peptidase [Candidatus Poseidoniaceae archaeon]|nr:SOS response-associated peptidase [Candidatus Poseidoniaceae archaeon]